MEEKRQKGLSNSTLDKLWAKKVKKLARNKCELCGNTEGLNSHHIQPKKSYSVRWDLDNGICLCNECHQKSPWSAHKNPLFFIVIITKYRGDAWWNGLTYKTAKQIDWKSRLLKIKESLL